MKFVILAAIAAIASPAVAADQFDLVCSGTETLGQFAKPHPVEVRYRIDLATGSWCVWKCATVRPIASIEAGRLILQDVRPQSSGAPEAFEEIDRVTGRWRSSAKDRRGSGSYSAYEGICVPAAFSGFPKTKF